MLAWIGAACLAPVMGCGSSASNQDAAPDLGGIAGTTGAAGTTGVAGTTGTAGWTGGAGTGASDASADVTPPDAGSEAGEDTTGDAANDGPSDCRSTGCDTNSRCYPCGDFSGTVPKLIYICIPNSAQC